VVVYKDCLIIWLASSGVCWPFKPQVGEDWVVGVGLIVFVVLRNCELTTAGPSRTSTPQSSGGSGSSGSDFDNIAKYYYNCGYEAVMYETDATTGAVI